MGSPARKGNMGALDQPLPPVRLAQMGMGGGAPPAPPRTASDAPSLGWIERGAPGADPSALQAGEGPKGPASVPLGQLADVRISGGAPMIRDENGLLVGYVYVDLDPAQRDVGGYVLEAKEAVRRAQADGSLTVPPGNVLEWTGQYELLEKMRERMKLVIPLTLFLIVLLLWLHFRNFTEVLIVLLSIPFALVGSVWLLWALDYHLSTAVWVGVIALVGLAAQTGVVMIVYIDHAFERRREAGKIRDLSDIVWAHMEGTVQRVRPKLMTVATMLAGLVPLLWATGSGADVMKRIAAPMVGGLLTSAFLTLEIIPVVYTYWRREQLLFERLAARRAPVRVVLERLLVVQKAAWAALFAVVAGSFYVDAPRWALVASAGGALLVALVAAVLYLRRRPLAVRLVWPAESSGPVPIRETA
jgi:Cu(I)/Ag(I) efflux system membrane protein CusA/SilA